MTANRTFILRHGHSEANAAGLIVSDLQRGRSGYGLTEQGREQVRHTFRQTSLPTPVVIVSSPFLRAVQTAEIAADHLGVSTVTQDDRLRERWFGEFELTKDTNYQKVWGQDAIDPTHTQWQVESTAEVAERLADLYTALNDRYPKHAILLVAHGDMASTLLCWAQGEDLRHHREIGSLATGCIAEVKCKRC